MCVGVYMCMCVVVCAGKLVLWAFLALRIVLLTKWSAFLFGLVCPTRPSKNHCGLVFTTPPPPFPTCWNGSLRTVNGTPSFLAPEALHTVFGTGRGFNAKVDVWASGILGFILATGAHPFHSEDESEVCLIVYVNVCVCMCA